MKFLYFRKHYLINVMYLLNPVYYVFYHELFRCLKLEIEKRLGKQVDDAESVVWEENEIIFKSFLQSGIKVSAKHFYRKKSDLGISRSEVVLIKDDIFISLCNRALGINFDEDKNRTSDPPRLKAICLYFRFMEQYCPEYIESERIRLGHNFKGHKDEVLYRAVDESDRVTKKVYFQAEAEKIDPHQSITTLIRSFYRHVDNKEIKRAWDLLDRDFQERMWKSDFKKFESGYSHTTGARNVHVFDIDEANFTCKVYYEDEVAIQTSLDLISLDKITLSQLPLFVSRIEAFRASEEKKISEPLNSVEIVKLFDRTLSEYLKFTRDISIEDIADFLPIRETHITPRLFRIACGKEGVEWRIKSIHVIKPVLLR